MIEKKKLFLPAAEKMLSKAETIEYFNTLQKTLRIESDNKPRFHSADFNESHLNQTDFIDKLLEIGEHDKHHDLDLIIYPDRREQIRKTPRTAIRERSLEAVKNRQSTMDRFININPDDVQHYLVYQESELGKFADDLANQIKTLYQYQNILGQDFIQRMRELDRLVTDIGESFSHCEDMRTFRATSYFLYLAYDEVYDFIEKRLQATATNEEDKLASREEIKHHLRELKSHIDPQATNLLRHYAASVVKNDLEYEQDRKNNPLQSETISEETMSCLGNLQVKEKNDSIHRFSDISINAEEEQTKHQTPVAKTTLALEQSKSWLGDDVTTIANQLRKLSLRDQKLAQKRKDDPDTLPMSKNQFIKALMEKYKKDLEENPKLTIESCAIELIDKIKSSASVGEYGRFSSVISEANVIPCGETIIYSPVNKQPSNLPSAKFSSKTTGTPNPLVTAMVGSQELWRNRANDDVLPSEVETFYKENKQALDTIIKNKRFVHRFDTFYPKDFKVNATLTLPDNKTQGLCIFESNTTQINGGQLIICAAAGVPQHIVSNVKITPTIERILTYKYETGKYPPSFTDLDEETKEYIAAIPDEEISKLIPSLSAHVIGKKYQTTLFSTIKTGLSPEALIESFPIDESAHLPMSERGDIVFLLGCEFDEKYAIFQNSHDTASVKELLHCYGVRKDEICNKEPIPLFTAKTTGEPICNVVLNKTHVVLEKMDWPATCYRLSVPAPLEDTDIRLAIANTIQELQNKMMSEYPDCAFTFISCKNGDKMEFYIGLRKSLDKSPLANAHAESYGLQPPFNGGLEFAGIHTMKNEEEFLKYQKLISSLPIAGQQIVNEIQKEALQKLCPVDHAIRTFEGLAKQTFNVTFDNMSNRPKQHAITSPTLQNTSALQRKT